MKSKRPVFPRQHPRHPSSKFLVDSGKNLSKEKCFNCGSGRFRQTVSTEYCRDCGLSFDYWGKGGNKIYNNVIRRDLVEYYRGRDIEESEANDFSHSTEQMYDEL